MFDEPPLLHRTYGDNPARLKLVSALLANPRKRFNIRELADEADVNESTAHEHKEFLLEADVAEKVPMNRNYDGYRLHRNSEIARIGREWQRAHEKQFGLDENKTRRAIEAFYG